MRNLNKEFLSAEFRGKTFLLRVWATGSVVLRAKGYLPRGRPSRSDILDQAKKNGGTEEDLADIEKTIDAWVFNDEEES